MIGNTAQKSSWQIANEKQREEFNWFKSLKPEERYKIKLNFEKRMRDWADNFYKSKGYFVDRRSDIEHDVTLIKQAKKITVEEKFRFRVYDDLMIELIQDISPRLQEWRKDWYGWFYRSKSDYLLVAFANSIHDNEPVIAYIVDMYRLKTNLKNLLLKGMQHSYIDSSQGWEQYMCSVCFSVNICVPWNELIMNKIATKVYERVNRLKTDEEYQRILEEGNYTKLTIDDMKWIDGNIPNNI